MSTARPPVTTRPFAELGKLGAFARRDVLTAWSYRVDFLSDLFSLFVQAILFYFVGLMVDEQTVPSFGGEPATYLEYVAIGIALGLFVQVALATVARVLREEQFMGTLEPLLLTPTRPWTIQIGSVVYDMLYVPLRTAAFLIVVAVAFDLDLDPGGLLPATAILLAFIPFMWALGLIAGATILVVRRGTGVVAFAATLLTISAGAYFPLDLLPDWLARIAELSPLAVTLDGMRECLLGGAGWAESADELAFLIPVSAVSLVIAALVFRRALARELRRGTLGHY